MSTEVEGYIRVIISIIVAVVLLWILIRFRAPKKDSPKSSLDILKERRDRGEITDEQYEQARKQQKGK